MVKELFRRRAHRSRRDGEVAYLDTRIGEGLVGAGSM